MPQIQLTRELNHKVAVFFLTFFSYALFHANRKAFSNVKSSTGRVWTSSVHNSSHPETQPDHIWNKHHLFDSADDALKYQGYLDTAFMLAYAAGLFFNGYVGDRINMRLLLTFGMGTTSVMIFLFGPICEWYGFYNKYFYMVVWIINGLAQSTGWPVVVACMGNWFGHGSRGLLLGLWSSCASVGNIIGALLVSSVLHYGYEYAFLTTTSALLGGTLCIFFGLVPSPLDVGLEEPKDKVVQTSESRYRSGSGRDRSQQPENDGKQINSAQKSYTNDGFTASETSKVDQVDHSNDTTNGGNGITSTGPALPEGVKVTKVKVEPLLSDSSDMNDDYRYNESNIESSASAVVYEIQTTKPALSFIQAVFLPGVIPYALAYAFLKLVNYSFFFWLPLYLHNAFGWKESLADQLSTVYDIAGIVGGTLSGYISDRIGKRSIIVVPMLLLSVPALFIYSHSPNDQLINSCLMAVIGFFIGGTANLISAAISADLGCQKALSGDDRALSTVTGVIDGSGSFGAALGQIAVPYLQLGLGWHSVFYMFMICMFLTAACLYPLFIKELKSFRWVANLLRCNCCGSRDCYTTAHVNNSDFDTSSK